MLHDAMMVVLCWSPTSIRFLRIAGYITGISGYIRVIVIVIYESLTSYGSRPETHIINYVGTCLIRAARLENAASRLAGDWMAIGHADIHGMLDLL